MRCTTLILGVIVGMVGMTTAVPSEMLQSLEARMVIQYSILKSCLLRQIADDALDENIAYK
jgi:RNA-binding protein YhbY